ncbi:ribose-5-phosphate isomerase 4 chloroplastic isoform X2 [Tripterygium wilfordii]|uniref:ribose-5-phosphate isomerase n=1 Tax=Tripterygium wilfordii TaxID=458696 RepID=A0A7J7C529_TRIWF|nr:ribose-5-phosphate isomerase 4 chloroplastic isoform X2 [Tripterygium wilfordii]
MPLSYQHPSMAFVGKRRTITRASNLSENSPLLRAAKQMVDTYIKNGMVIGLGSGNASAMAIQYLGSKLRAGALNGIIGIPTSEANASKAEEAGIPLDQYQDSSQIDFAFDDADIIEEGTLHAVIGRRRFLGEEFIIQEKLNWRETAEKIDDLFLGDAEVWRRSSIGQAGPLGGDFPFVTREGYNVLDILFTSPIESLAQVAESLNKVDGVVDHGIITKFPCTAVIVSENGLSVVDSLSTNAHDGL